MASPNDDRQYRLLTLDNDMPVLLISDPGTPKAAAALDVMVGSGDNPPGRAGLAHFLEHMLFLGTDKYPDAAEYERFITEHGGNRNAYTAFEHTNYFFDVNAPFLPEALDRFAQFFIAPRFDAEYVQREKNAVEAEYQMGLKSDSRRGLDVLQETMNPDHPFSQFVVGNLESLADRPDSAVRDELIRFYDRHYSANVMRLVVLGAQSLDELEALVVPMFSQVPNKNFEHQRIEVPPFEADRLPLLVQAVPQATLRQLQVSFPIADYRELYAVKPVSYLGNLVGHEGEGSLLSMLKAEGLAESLSAGEGLGWRGGALFSVSIALTAKGVRDYQRVLQLLFAYMDMLREAGPQEWLYGEQARLAELSFRFQEKTEPINYVSALAGAMHDYDDEDVLRGRYMMERFDREALAQLLGSITPDNAIVQLDDKHVSTDRVSTYYQVPYAARTLHADELAAWRSDAAQETLHLPAPNEFIAEDVALVELPAQSPPHPDVVLQTERQKIWFMPDAEFRLPKGATYINFRSVEVGHSARQNAAATLYAALLRDKVNELAYPAQLAGLSFSIYKHAQGISLRMHGYNDKQPRLLRHLLDAFADSTFDERRFADIRQDLIRSLRNSVADRPSSQVMNDLREALLYGEWGETALIAELQQLDQSALRRYARRFWASATAEVMIYGNYDRAIVNDVSKLLASVVQRGPAPALPPVKVLDLAAGEALQYAVAVPHDDAVVAWYLQGADDSWSDRAAADLTAQIVKSGFFQELRTQQQLGYVVAAFSWPQFEVPALVLLVQSPGTAAPEVAQAMQSYLQDVPAGLDRQQFERHRAALLSEILRPDKNLWERAEFYWQSIARKQWDFNGREALAEAVDAFTLDSWLDYYQRVFLRLPHSLQVVAPGRWGLLPAHSERPFTSAEAIKEDHEAYRVD
ncbi:MAG: insulinase family protein [Halioglobus sp.]|nr:insulinase family protein [Halioglobus sp.]